jgi:hypothetical protein
MSVALMGETWVVEKMNANQNTKEAMREEQEDFHSAIRKLGETLGEAAKQADRDTLSSN